MENTLSVFKFEDQDVRVLEIDGEPWWIGKDVAVILGYAKPENAIATHVDSEDKTTTLIQGTGSNYKSKTGIINESGLYSLIIGSKLPSAKKFKHWVTSVVLPSIRKHGTYIAEQETHKMTREELIAKALVAANSVMDEYEQRIASLEHERNILEAKTQEQMEQIEVMKPKAEYYDQILRCTNTLTVTQIAKDYGMSAVAFNKMLEKMGVQYCLNGQWILYQKYANREYTRSQTIFLPYSTYNHPQTKENTRWTQKGRLFLYEFLKKRNILPQCEQYEGGIA